MRLNFLRTQRIIFCATARRIRREPSSALNGWAAGPSRSRSRIVTAETPRSSRMAHQDDPCHGFRRRCGGLERDGQFGCTGPSQQNPAPVVSSRGRQGPQHTTICGLRPRSGRSGPRDRTWRPSDSHGHQSRWPRYAPGATRCRCRGDHTISFAVCRDDSERTHDRPPPASIERRSMTCRPMASIGISPV